jgi:AraC-like DNA-binding protein/quercetin dioxygenase-like cupin family protein
MRIGGVVRSIRSTATQKSGPGTPYAELASMIQRDNVLINPAKPFPPSILHIREIVGRHQVDVELGGLVRFDIQVSNSLHRHNFFECCYVLEGNGEFVHGSERYPLCKGDVFVSEPNVLHEISSRLTRDLEIYFVRFSIQELKFEAPAHPNVYVEFAREHRLHSSTDGSAVHYVRLLQSPKADAEKLLSIFTLALLKELLTHPLPAQTASQPSEFQSLFAFVQANPERNLRCRDLAEMTGMSERTLRRRFQTATGSSIMEEVNHLRMRAAAHRLLGGMTVQEVANSLGNMDPAQFHRTFKRTFGTTPKSFQKSYTPGTHPQSTRP